MVQVKSLESFKILTVYSLITSYTCIIHSSHIHSPYFPPMPTNPPPSNKIPWSEEWFTSKWPLKPAETLHPSSWMTVTWNCSPQSLLLRLAGPLPLFSYLQLAHLFGQCYNDVLNFQAAGSSPSEWEAHPIPAFLCVSLCLSFPHSSTLAGSILKLCRSQRMIL